MDFMTRQMIDAALLNIAYRMGRLEAQLDERDARLAAQRRAPRVTTPPEYEDGEWEEVTPPALPPSFDTGY